MIGRLALALVTFAFAVSTHAAEGSIFVQRCAVCHLETATGSPGFVPSLTDTLGYYVTVEGGRKYLAQVVTYGLSGPITVAGVPYDATMVLYAPLSDQEAADALNYVLTHFDRNSLPAGFEPFTAEEVHDARQEKLSALQMHTKRQGLLDELSRSGKHR
ncbi:MAG TPA: cytochrome c [Casimicrobiaceae bacterium]|jgi:mono/diheme cytochrome c family protein